MRERARILERKSEMCKWQKFMQIAQNRKVILLCDFNLISNYIALSRRVCMSHILRANNDRWIYSLRQRDRFQTFLTLIIQLCSSECTWKSVWMMNININMMFLRHTFRHHCVNWNNIQLTSRVTIALSLRDDITP